MSMIDWSAIGSIGTAVAVLVAAWQLRQSAQQSRTDFEDELSREYRDLMRALPVEALLNGALAEDQEKETTSIIFRYLDLSNEQAFLRMAGRVSRTTWRNWCQGMRSNFKKPAFAMAWGKLKGPLGESFAELRRLEKSGFRDDPRDWVPRWRRWLRRVEPL